MPGSLSAWPSTRRKMATTSCWRLGSLSKPCCPGCQRRPLDGSLAPPTPAPPIPEKPRARSVRRMELVPLREFYGHPFRAVDEHQLSRVEIHDLVPGLKPVRSELGNFSLDVFDCKTDVVHPNFVEVANVRIGERLGLPVAQKLDFRSWGRVLEHERDVIGLDTWNAHVTGKWLSGNHDGHGFFEPQESKNLLARSTSRTTIVQWSKCFTMLPHLRACLPRLHRPCVPTAIISRVPKACRSGLIGPATALRLIRRL